MKNKNTIIERDLKIAEFLSQLESINNKVLKDDFEKLVDIIYTADDSADFKNYKANKVKKQNFMALSFIIIGVIIALIPSLFYISSLKKDDIRPLTYIPNVMGYPKAAYVQIVKTQEEVDLIKKSSIRDAEMADIGSALKLGRTGLNLMPSEEMNSESYHLKNIGIQEHLIKDINGFTFKPDTLWTRDPINLQLISTPTELEAAKKMKGLNNKDLLNIGAAITCPSAVCFVTAKATLETEYTKVVPISEL